MKNNKGGGVGWGGVRGLKEREAYLRGGVNRGFTVSRNRLDIVTCSV